ncbi:hypothetical protein [Flindersiella endophytica]
MKIKLRRVAIVMSTLLLLSCAAVSVPLTASADTGHRQATSVVTPQSCTPSSICNPWGSGVNIRNTPNASGNALFLNYGNGLFINCWQTGQTITGPWGTSNIWDFISWSSQYGYDHQGYVSDTYVYTGTNGPPPGLGRCPPGLVGNV